MKLYCVLALVLVGACALVQGQVGGGGAGSRNPMSTYLMWQMLRNDPKLRHMPIMHMLMRNPALMYNPMGAYLMANTLGVDLHKIATPMAMANPMGGAAGMMRWMPLLMGDPNTLSLLYSFSGGFGAGAGAGLGAMG